ncbi:NAD(P)/FAD-dependent oxidoreductase, partial [Haematobacter sp. UBA3484]
TTSTDVTLFDLGDPVETTPWSGTRPCMPGMLPLVGAAPNHKGLWFNFGHGHQGFTLGPTTALLLAEQMSGLRTNSLAASLKPARRISA